MAENKSDTFCFRKFWQKNILGNPLLREIFSSLTKELKNPLYTDGVFHLTWDGSLYISRGLLLQFPNSDVL